MAKHRHRTKLVAKEIAYERIVYLFDLAATEHTKDPAISDRCVALAKRIGMRYRVSLPAELKRRMCKGCGAYLTPGNNCRVRTRSKQLQISCLDCGRMQRYPLKAKARPRTSRKTRGNGSSPISRSATASKYKPPRT